MPRDKTATNAKVIAYMRYEFLTYGYEKASLNRIAGQVGITTAGLYKHFRGKEEMFAFLVREALDDLEKLTEGSTAFMVGGVPDYDPFCEEWSRSLVDFIFDHHEAVKLLVCCSHGSRFERFEEDLIQRETESNKQYAAMLAMHGKTVKPLTDMQWHLLSTQYIHLVCEILRHDLTRDEAYRHMEFVRSLLYPGWRELFGL